MENNDLSNFFDTKFSNQELKTRYEEFYQYLCENGVKRDFDKTEAKARDLGGCLDPISYGAAAFTINFLHKDKPLDENDKINEINAILLAFSFKLTENTTKSEIENISNTIEKFFLAIMSVDPKIFDIKSFDFFMSDDVTAERYMKIYDAVWAARDAWCLVEKYLDILERNEKLDEQAEMDPDRKGDYNNLKVKLALNRDELEKVAVRLDKIKLLRNYTVRVLDDLFINSDSLPIEMAEFAKIKDYGPIAKKRGWLRAIEMKKSQDKEKGVKIIKEPHYEKTMVIISSHQDLTLNAIRELKDADLEKDIIKKLEMNISGSEREKPVGTKEQENRETNLNQKVETKEKDIKNNSDEKENEQIQEKSTAQVKENENQTEVNKLEKEKLKRTEGQKKQETNLNQKIETEGKDRKNNSDEKKNEQIQKKSTAQVKENEKQAEVNKLEEEKLKGTKGQDKQKTNFNQKVETEEKDRKDNSDRKENEQMQEKLTVQIKEDENQPEVNKLEKEKLEGAKKPEKQETNLNQKAETEEKDIKDEQKAEKLTRGKLENELKNKLQEEKSATRVNTKDFILNQSYLNRVKNFGIASFAVGVLGIFVVVVVPSIKIIFVFIPVTIVIFGVVTFGWWTYKKISYKSINELNKISSLQKQNYSLEENLDTATKQPNTVSSERNNKKKIYYNGILK